MATSPVEHAEDGKYEECEALILDWAASFLGPREVPWSEVEVMIASAVELSDASYTRLKQALLDSSRALKPLDDPLLVDFGTHRWLRSNREESYSDWLAWILEQLSAEQILRIFGIDVEQYDCSLLTSAFCVRREQSIDTGRLDIVVDFGNELLLVIEIKKTAAEASDTEKQVGYAEFARGREYKYQPELLLVTTEAERSVYEGNFKSFLWADVCLGLRRLLPDIAKPGADGGIGLSASAMMCAFVGAVEQNLLGLTNGEACLGRPDLAAVPRTTSHLLRVRNDS